MGVLPVERMQFLGFIPFKLETDDTLHVAICEPPDRALLENVMVELGRKIVPYVVTYSAYRNQLRVLRGEATPAPVRAPEPAMAPRLTTPIAVPQAAPAPAAAAQPRVKPTQNITPARVRKIGPSEQVTPVLNELLTEAVTRGASDVHIEPHPGQVRVRIRLGGALFDIASIVPELREQLISRIKVFTGMDTTERRMPQDGRAKLKVGGEEVNFRVSTIPSLYGETAVFRVLRQNNLNMELDKIGFDQRQLTVFRKGIEAPNGMVLITGPTGSGKTTTVYSALGLLNTPTVKVATVEDPIEYNLPGITQIPVNKETGLGFAEVLKSLLRQDPDVLLVGEIRDKDTAVVTVQAALTGHIVFSSLHTNDAPSAVIRLLNMGVEPFAVLAAMNVVVAQRLVRTICTACAEKTDASAMQLRSLGEDRALVETAKLMHGRGCDECFGGGYRGRTAIFEVLEMTDSLKELYLKGENLISMKRHAAMEGMTTLRQSALALAARGITTLEEAIAHTQER
jgi:type IV pilus assembly protein PilB